MTTTTTTSTRTETWLSVHRAEHGGRVVVRHHSLGGPDRPVIRPVLLASDEDRATVSLVPEGALLLAGDDVSLHVDVGDGVALELREPAGTVAYDMRGGRAGWDVTISLGALARLAWHAEPFVVAAGADVRRRLSVTLGAGARLALRETVVLGRHGEPGGRLDQTLTVATVEGVPLLVEALSAPATTKLHDTLAWGGHNVMSSLLAIGVDVPTAQGTRFDLEGGGWLVRALGDHAHAVDLGADWSRLVTATLAH